MPKPPPAFCRDDTIVEKLREAGIDIARRTVAKYREAGHAHTVLGPATSARKQARRRPT